MDNRHGGHGLRCNAQARHCTHLVLEHEYRLRACGPGSLSASRRRRLRRLGGRLVSCADEVPPTPRPPRTPGPPGHADRGAGHLYDKNTLTADPRDARSVYAVWDRRGHQPSALDRRGLLPGRLPRAGQCRHCRAAVLPCSWPPQRRRHPGPGTPPASTSGRTTRAARHREAPAPTWAAFRARRYCRAASTSSTPATPLQNMASA